MDKKLSHLEMIQGVVNRLSHNSFLLKGWSVILVSALFALAAGDSRIYFVYLAYLPAIAFWLLDAYYLWQERLFRALYDHVRSMKDDEIDFSMNVPVVESKVGRWAEVIFCKTLLVFHATLVVAILAVMFVNLALSNQE